ncbi:MAG: DUF523 domain-containing protein [Deltaproteobacteria bacterium]|nr:DUF523 domain-containing protein [Deltaproteobacteria bacterium]
MRGPILISACLAGLRTRFDGKAAPHPRLGDLISRAVLVPVCPEILGGLGIPRPRCRFVQGDGVQVLAGSARVVDETGQDRTEGFIRGAQEALRIVELISPRLIVLKEGSPSCGLRRVDVQGHMREGCGVAVALLRGTRIRIITEDDPIPKD